MEYNVHVLLFKVGNVNKEREDVEETLPKHKRKGETPTHKGWQR
jgi:hypothetical protein